MEQRELKALAKINSKLSVLNREFKNDGTCIACMEDNEERGTDTYTTEADVSGTKMITLICNDCGAALPLLKV